jgi:hypothetical protein
VMTELPIAGVHGMQVTGRDEFLLIVRRGAAVTGLSQSCQQHEQSKQQKPRWVLRACNEDWRALTPAAHRLERSSCVDSGGPSHHLPCTPPSPPLPCCLCIQDFIAGEHPPSWNRTYNLVTWQRSSNTWQSVPWFNNTLKDAGCGEPACTACCSNPTTESGVQGWLIM